MFFHLGLIILQSLKFVQSYRQTVEILYLRLCESNYLQLKVYVPTIYSYRTFSACIDYTCLQGVNPRNKNLEYNINFIPPRIRFFKEKAMTLYAVLSFVVYFAHLIIFFCIWFNFYAFAPIFWNLKNTWFLWLPDLQPACLYHVNWVIIKSYIPRINQPYSKHPSLTGEVTCSLFNFQYLILYF